MTDSMPRFVILRNGVELDVIGAVSYEQAIVRARKAYGRCEVIAVGNVKMDKAANGKRGRNDMNRTHGRSPCATPGFEARRAALIEAFKAGAL